MGTSFKALLAELDVIGYTSVFFPMLANSIPSSKIFLWSSFYLFTDLSRSPLNGMTRQ